MITIKVDIIGGGISGFSTAISIKENNKNIDVFVHEKNKKIGYNHEGRKCGEAHSVEKEWNKWIPEEKSYFNNITKGEVFIGTKKRIYTQEVGIGYMLNRQEFICQLARKAKKLGAKIKVADKIRSIEELDGKYVVDASGCPSIVKKELGLKRGYKGIGYQQTIENSNCFVEDTIKIWYSGKFGYYWIFPRNPKKKEINVGLGFNKNYNYKLKELLEEFKEKQNITGEINYESGGVIPIGLQRPLLYQNILFVGDAGVGTFPFSGQGIYRALLSGEDAGKCIAHNKVQKYPHIINQKFIKYDVIGQFFMISNNVYRKINPILVLNNVNLFASFTSNIIH